jgi:hypothetical protein
MVPVVPVGDYMPELDDYVRDLDGNEVTVRSSRSRQ